MNEGFKNLKFLSSGTTFIENYILKL